ncbi:hypothetical protein KIN20_030440 [Parelaphostrongylus tenuis]|uniref:Uncharacterized protein n=1 Tax=Parelaphostrongylus tenuis TaxID=148309 RepID=A0AAD5R3R3_PARTN|nr:hypothetical protein KIN20_030440 [Parelaphostrongylus tenuis]
MDCANFCEELKATATEPIPMVDLDTRQLAEQDPLAVAAMVVEKLLSKEREVPDEEKVRGVNIATNTPGTEERPRTPPRSEKTVKTRGRRPKKNNQTEQVGRSVVNGNSVSFLSHKQPSACFSVMKVIMHLFTPIGPVSSRCPADQAV